MRRLTKPALAAPGPEEEGTFVDPDANTIWWFQGPRHWNPEIDVSRFKVMVHFRDPRDLACNQYWWALQHPNTKDSPEEAERKRLKVEAMGLEKYALGRNNFAAYAPMMAISEGPTGDDTTYTSYAQLCSAFDLLVDNLCRVFDCSPSSVAEKLIGERPESLFNNPDWVKVGGTWKGADISPGRYRRELSPEGIKQLTEKWRKELDFCAQRDASFLSYLYE
ncbi:MAG: hypothetical protein B7Y99_03095 [Caulobacterales bacterium 32-69-10]|nr:MAG: hypothetical protein B7Y99_03095 [Caulobacterales bacterium 32-69-10]